MGGWPCLIRRTQHAAGGDYRAGGPKRTGTECLNKEERGTPELWLEDRTWPPSNILAPGPKGAAARSGSGIRKQGSDATLEETWKSEHSKAMKALTEWRPRPLRRRRSNPWHDVYDGEKFERNDWQSSTTFVDILSLLVPRNRDAKGRRQSLDAQGRMGACMTE